jgi:hypothetical protein
MQTLLLRMGKTAQRCQGETIDVVGNLLDPGNVISKLRSSKLMDWAGVGVEDCLANDAEDTSLHLFVIHLAARDFSHKTGIKGMLGLDILHKALLFKMGYA